MLLSQQAAMYKEIPSPESEHVTFFEDLFGSNSIADYETGLATASASISGGTLNVSGGDGNWLTNYIAMNKSGNPWVYNNASTWVQTVVYTVGNTPAATTYGIAVGFRSANAHGELHSAYAWLDLTNGVTNRGRISLYEVEGSSPNFNLMSQSGAGSRLTIANGDTITFTVRFSNSLFEGTAVQTGSVSDSTSIIGGWRFHNVPPADQQMPNTGRWSIVILGGSQAITSWTITDDPVSILMLYRDFILVGDDNVIGQWQEQTVGGSAADRWSERFLVSVTTKTGNFSAGPGDCTSEVILKLPALLALKPRYVVLNIGSNDIAEGVSSGTWQANLVTIRNTLVAEGIEVIWLYIMPRNDFDVTPVNTFIAATFTDTIVDTFTPLKDGGTGLNATYDFGDGRNINYAGANLIFSTLSGALAFLLE